MQSCFPSFQTCPTGKRVSLVQRILLTKFRWQQSWKRPLDRAPHRIKKRCKLHWKEMDLFKRETTEHEQELDSPLNSSRHVTKRHLLSKLSGPHWADCFPGTAITVDRITAAGETLGPSHGTRHQSTTWTIAATGMTWRMTRMTSPFYWRWAGTCSGQSADADCQVF